MTGRRSGGTKKFGRWIHIPDRELTKLIRDLETIRSKAVPFAVKAGVDDSAKAAQQEWWLMMEQKMTLRAKNNWTKGSVKVKRARFNKKVAGIKGEVGSIQPYMRTQEFGGVKAKKSKHGVPIPTGIASNEGRGARPRKRPIVNSRRLSRIDIMRGTGTTRFQRNFNAIRKAREGGNRKTKYVYLELRAGRKGLFRLQGKQLDLIYDLSHPTVRIPRNPTLKPALKRAEPRFLSLHLRALRRELRKAKFKHVR